MKGRREHLSSHVYVQIYQNLAVETHKTCVKITTDAVSPICFYRLEFSLNPMDLLKGDRKSINLLFWLHYKQACWLAAGNAMTDDSIVYGVFIRGYSLLNNMSQNNE